MDTPRLTTLTPAHLAFDHPIDVAVSADGTLYVSDSYNHRIQVRYPNGSWTFLGGRGKGAGQFFYPRGLAVGADGSLYVADWNNARIQKRSPVGTWSSWGSYGQGAGQFNGLNYVAVGKDGTIYASDTVRVQTRYLNSTWAVWDSAGDGLEKIKPGGLALGPDGTLYVADPENNRILWRNTDGTWGRIDSRTSSEGRLSYPWDVAVSTDGNLFVADTGNGRIMMRDPRSQLWTSWGRKGGLLHTPVAGTGTGEFYTPFGLTLGPDGTLYVADTGNNRVQARSPDGTWSEL